ncbi:MAG: histidine phosphatase family protein [Acidobacteriota bacterium]
MNLTVYLMRHGQTEPETPWRFLGQRDVALSDKGRARAAAWREALRGVNFAGAWCSELARSRETAALVLEGRGLAATPVAGLREICLGEWDGLSVADVKRRYPGLYEARGADIAGFRPPGGESFADLSNRAWAALENILAAAGAGPPSREAGIDASAPAARAQPAEESDAAGARPAGANQAPGEADADNGATLLVVAHAGVNRTIVARLLGMPVENLFRLGQDHGCLNILSFGPGRPRLARANLVPGMLPC